LDEVLREAGRAQEAAPSVLTFLIADVRGYTQFTVEHGDEAARLATRFAAVARHVVSAREGTVIE
jgi:class 3 adenylate cyclase